MRGPHGWAARSSRAASPPRPGATKLASRWRVVRRGPRHSSEDSRGADLMDGWHSGVELDVVVDGGFRPEARPPKKLGLSAPAGKRTRACPKTDDFMRVSKPGRRFEKMESTGAIAPSAARARAEVTTKDRRAAEVRRAAPPRTSRKWTSRSTRGSRVRSARPRTRRARGRSRATGRLEEPLGRGACGVLHRSAASRTDPIRAAAAPPATAARMRFEVEVSPRGPGLGAEGRALAFRARSATGLRGAGIGAELWLRDGGAQAPGVPSTSLGKLGVLGGARPTISPSTRQAPGGGGIR